MFATVRVTDWDAACALGSALFSWGFRGHADAGWPMESMLARTAKRLGCPREWLNDREYWMLRQFQRQFPAYLRDLPAPVTNLDWLALMQHHGSATRLLDFTYSFYVAAFFAIEAADGDAAVWAVNKPKLNGVIDKHRDWSPAADSEKANERYSNLAEEFLDEKMRRPFPELVLPIEPKYLHARLTAQQGFFLCPIDLHVPFLDCLEATFGLPASTLTNVDQSFLDQAQVQSNIADFSVLKIILPKHLHWQAAKDLQMMNISSSTLFPGLDGYARSMQIHLRVLLDENDPRYKDLVRPKSA